MPMKRKEEYPILDMIEIQAIDSGSKVEGTDSAEGTFIREKGTRDEIGCCAML